MVGYECMNEPAFQGAADGSQLGGTRGDSDHMMDFLNLLQRPANHVVIEVGANMRIVLVAVAKPNISYDASLHEIARLGQHD